MFELIVVVGMKYEGHSPPGVDSTTWETIVGCIWRRGERMIPWRSGRQGTWSLNDPFEEIYLDDFSREEVFIQIVIQLTLDCPIDWKNSRISSQKRDNTTSRINRTKSTYKCRNSNHYSEHL